MKDKFARSFQYFSGMSALKKVLIVFVALLIFIIVVEQPGSESSKKIKNIRYFLPRLVTEDVQKIQIKKPDADKPITLEKKDNRWKVTNDHALPADETKVSAFLKSMLALQLGDLVSKNKDHVSIYMADEAQGVHVQVWDKTQKTVADFYAGQTIPEGQYLRRADSSEVYKTIPTLDPYLHQDSDAWKDKTLIAVKEDTAATVSLVSNDSETTLEKDDKGSWNEAGPENNPANELSVRTLFDKLKQLQADSFADIVDASQINFTKPDYKISVNKTDGSSDAVLFSGPDTDGKYYAKNAGSDFVYNVSKSMIDNIFGLNFKPEDTSKNETPASIAPENSSSVK